MIINRTPLRISFAGGGSDLPDFFTKYGGAVISTTIDKYIHIFVHSNFETDKILMKYSKTEEVRNPKYLENSIARTILSQMKLNGLEIASSGDMPAGTGLGSSSAFAVSLYHALNTHIGKKVSTEKLAQYACETEIIKLGYPIGKQDQYASAYGGLNFYQFHKNGQVTVEPIKISPKKKRELDQNLVLFYTGITRSANDILEKQKINIKKSPNTVSVIKKMVDITFEMKKTLEKNNIKKFGELLHKSWSLKQSIADGITNTTIDKYYKIGIKNGALGGKLLGAGGGGCLLFYCEKKNQDKLKKSLKNLRHIPFSFTDVGSEIIFNI